MLTVVSQTVINELLELERIFNRVIYPFKNLLIPFQITTSFAEHLVTNIQINTSSMHSHSKEIPIQTKKFLELNIKRVLRNLMYDTRLDSKNLVLEDTFQTMYPAIVKSLFKNILTDWEIKNLILTPKQKAISDTSIKTPAAVETLFESLQNYKSLHSIPPLAHLNLLYAIGKNKDKYPVLPYVTSATYFVKLTSAVYKLDTSLSLFFVSTFIKALQNLNTLEPSNPLLEFLKKLNQQLTHSFNELQNIHNISLMIEKLDITNQKILKIIYRSNKINKSNLQKKVKMSGPTIYRRTTSLKKLGLLEIIKINKETYYKLSPRVRYYLWLRKDYVSTLLWKRDTQQP